MSSKTNNYEETAREGTDIRRRKTSTVCLSWQYTQHISSEVLNPPGADGGLQIQGIVPNVGMVIQEVQGTELRTPTRHIHLGHWSQEAAALTVRFEALLLCCYLVITIILLLLLYV